MQAQQENNPSKKEEEQDVPKGMARSVPLAEADLMKVEPPQDNKGLTGGTPETAGTAGATGELERQANIPPEQSDLIKTESSKNNTK